MTRSAAATVRWPGASIAPTSRVWAFSQACPRPRPGVGLRNSVAKGWSTGKMASGRVSMAGPSVRSGFRPAYPVFFTSPNFCVKSRQQQGNRVLMLDLARHQSGASEIGE